MRLYYAPKFPFSQELLVFTAFKKMVWKSVEGASRGHRCLSCRDAQPPPLLFMVMSYS